MAGRGEDKRRPCDAPPSSEAPAPRNTAVEPSSLSATASEFVSNQSPFSPGRSRPSPNESISKLGARAHLYDSQNHPQGHPSGHNLDVQRSAAGQESAHGLGSSNQLTGGPSPGFTSLTSRRTDDQGSAFFGRVQPDGRSESATRSTPWTTLNGDHFTSSSLFNNLNIDTTPHPTVNASSSAFIFPSNTLPTSISMPNNLNRPQYGTSTGPPPTQVMSLQPGAHHVANYSIDSAFSQPGPHARAELIRSGRAENPHDLNGRIIGPHLTRDDRDGYRTLSERTRPLSNPEGPLPPPVSGFTGGPRPRYGQSTHQNSTGAEIDTVPNTNGPAAAFLGTSEDQLPAWVTMTEQTSHQPKVQEVMRGLPMIEACRLAVPSTAGVIKIKNPPYTTTRSEILAFVGRNTNVCAQPPGSQYWAVHIITNRFSGATMDAFVEIGTKEDAVKMVNHFDKRRREGRPVMIGDRECFVYISSQNELMEELFTRAKFTSWQGAGPKVSGLTPMYYSDRPSTGFNGFFDSEELAQMAKIAQTPERFPISIKCHIRVYETLVSVLHKYPWSAPELILVRERNDLFDVVKTSVRALIVRFAKLKTSARQAQQDSKTEPRPQILQELVVAVLTCPGFSEEQKAKVVLDVANSGFGDYLSARGMSLRFGGVHNFAKHWPFKALVMKPSAPVRHVEGVIALLKQAMIESGTVNVNRAFSMAGSSDRFPDLEIDYSHTKTLADVAVAELQHVEGLLRQILQSMDRTPRQVHTFSS